MADKTSAKVSSKEEQLAKVSRINMIRSILPIAGLVGIFILFNVLTGGGMWNSRSLILSQVYVVVISAMGVFFIMTMGGL
ncbi:MAG: ABC transporter permease, partial [Lachnospiraceae bacterium]|nr:ABC transporter permease [Lachnospiraceae bacterium]